MIVIVTYIDHQDVRAEVALIPDEVYTEALMFEGKILLEDQDGMFYLKTDDIIDIQSLMLN